MAKREKSVMRDGLTVSMPSPKRRIEGTVNEKTQTMYANNTFVEVSNWDVRIRLGLIQSATKDLVTVLDVAHVYMSHEHARAFATALTTTPEQIEALRSKAAASAGKG